MARQRKKGRPARPLYVRSKRRTGKDQTVAWRRAVTVVLLVLVLGGLGFGVKTGLDWVRRKLFSENPRFTIQHLVISSDGKISEDRIREFTGLSEGRNLFDFTFHEIESLLEKIPDVDTVYLQRQLPHTLIVKVRERVPVARITGRQAMRYPYVIDHRQMVMPPRLTSSTLPLIQGLDADLRLGTTVNHPDVRTALDIIAKCESTGNWRQYVQIESLDVRYQDYIDMRLKDGFQVKIPRYNIAYNLRRLVATIQTMQINRETRRVIDLTVESGIPVANHN